MPGPAGSAIVALALLCGAALTQPTRRSDTTPRLTPMAAPAGAFSSGIEWIAIDAPGLGVLSTGVARPAGPGPHPAIAILHGSHGFAHEYVELARALAGGGFVAVAACWGAGGSGAGTAYVTPIACADAPPMPEPGSAAATPIVAALVDAVRALPGVHADRVGLFGHSRGGGAVLGYLLAGGRVQAAVLHSTGYPPERVAAARGITTPILILHGVADSPIDGGGPMTGIARARAFEAALRRAGRSVDAHYYEAGEHNGLFRDPAQREDSLARMFAFFGTVLR